MPLAGGGRLGGDDLDQPRVQRQAVLVVGGQLRVGGLAEPRHVADRRDRPHVVVMALEAPGAHGGVVHGAVEGQVQLEVPLQRVELVARAAQAALQLRVVGDVVGQRVPVAGRRLRVGAVGPELGDDPRPIAALDDVGCVRIAGDRIQRVATAVVGSQAVVPECARRDVRQHAVVRGERGTVVHYLSERHLVLAAAVASQVGWRARVEVDAVVDHAIRRQRERGDRAPVGADEALHAAWLLAAGLIHEQAQGQRLPAVGVVHGARSGVRYHHRPVGGTVLPLERVGAQLVGAVVVAQVDDPVADAVAERRRARSFTFGVVGVVAELRHQVVEAGQRLVRAGGVAVPVVQHAVGGIADRLVACRGDVAGGGALVGQDRPRGVVVGSPGVPHGDRDVVEVAGVNGRAGEVVADRLQ